MTWSPKLVTGLGLAAVIVLFGLVGPLLTGDPATIRDIGLTPPGGEHVLGTTLTGQDVLAQLANATRGSLWIGVLATTGSLKVGSTVSVPATNAAMPIAEIDR